MIIVDVGAYDGKFSMPFAQDINNIVYAIELIPELVEQICSHNKSNIHVFCTAMGEQECESSFYINTSNLTSFFLAKYSTGNLESNVEEMEFKTRKVNVTRLDTFIKQNTIAEIDLLKINAPGYEFQVLKGAGKYIHSIQKILIQVYNNSIYKNVTSKEELVEYLTNKGFRLVYTPSLTEGLKENLEFVRINRYSIANQQLGYFDVKIPYVGVLRTPTNDCVGQFLEQGIFEGPEQAFLWLYLRPGDTFFDCGSHAGLFSCIAAKRLCNTGRIVGFDPNPICFQLYEHNLKNVGCDCFTALNLGLSEAKGCGELLLGKPGMSAFSTFAKATKTDPYIGNEKLLVEQLPLDDVLQNLDINRVDLAKIDVEGWETFVLRGAHQSINAGKFPLLMIEFTEANAVAAGSSTRELRRIIESFGYTLCSFNPTNFCLIPEPIRQQYYYANLFAVMDVEKVNKRLANADSEAVEVAKDIISRWDMAISAAKLQLTLIQEKQSSHELRQWVERSDAAIAEKSQIIQELQNSNKNLEVLLAAERQLVSNLQNQLKSVEVVHSTQINELS
ncbi:FkbM family methyltransferase [Argonema galeatum]|uniref:FkbM family methyltransferase n=1 Tax=Argonema galeatum TaxID=2942762 RepID=UPI0020139840|nr:FkbM family methyltransferase [Argonema galeatum]MCL1467474.1 FkbM family methyltransferase [Argonema galeatum A003/A1]